MDGMSGYTGWVMWVLMFLGTAAFWVVIFLAVRALYIGRDMGGSPASEGSEDREADPLQERLARGEISAEEYADQRARILPGSPPSRPPHR